MLQPSTGIQPTLCQSSCKRNANVNRRFGILSGGISKKGQLQNAILSGWIAANAQKPCQDRNLQRCKTQGKRRTSELSLCWNAALAIWTFSRNPPSNCSHGGQIISSHGNHQVSLHRGSCTSAIGKPDLSLERHPSDSVPMEKFSVGTDGKNIVQSICPD